VERQDVEPLGTAPLDFDLRPGPHRVYLSKPGFVDEEVLVVVEPRETAVVTKALAPRTGTIVVSADMVDALVELDGKPAGFAPTVLVVPVGPHRVRVSFAGYRSEEKNLDVQEDAKLGEHFQLLRVEEVNAASRFTESAEDASTSVTIISREEIQAMAYPTLTEALRSVRGMYLTDTRDYPSAGFLTRSGDYNSRILLLVDGAIANDNYNWTAYMDFDGRVDLDDIERIEILRGPGSVLYGTGAELGVINLVTRREKERTHGEVGAGTVQYGVTRGRAALFWRPTEHAGARVTAAAAHGLGRDFYFSEFAEDPQTLGTIRGLDGFDALHTNGSVWYKDLSLQWQLHARDKTIPTGQSGAALGQPTRYSDARGFLEVKFEPKLSSAVRSSTTAQLNRYAYHDLIFRTGGTERTVFVGDWLHLEQRLSYTWGSGARLTAGGVYERHFRVDLDKVQAAEPRKESRPFDLGAAYATLDLAPTRAVKLSLGGRVDAYSDRNASISPRLAAVFRPQPDDIVKVLAGRAFRAPGTFELQYQSGLSEGAPRLKPEECYSTGVEYTHRFSTTITGLLESFANATTNYITLRGEGDGARYVNLDATLANVGAGAELRREWRQGWMLAVHGTVQSAWYEGGASTRPVTNVPGTIGSIRGAIPLLGRGLTMTHRLTYNGPRWDRFENESEPPQERTGAALLWDAVLGGESDNGDWRYAVGAYNLFDWRWTVPTSAEFGVLRSIPQNGRTFLASLSASF
jgi:outer membrane receptor for ferrienterochelin and colicin